jgi:serine/threonine protein kinase
MVLGSPIPAKSGDITNDLSWLRNVLVELDALVHDEEITELVKALDSKNPDNRPSAGIVEARLEGVAPQIVAPMAPIAPVSSGSSDYLSRYENQDVLARHTFGETVRAFDADLKKSVILKRESGRPETSWALREYRALVSESIANSSGTVDVFAGGTFGNESYVVTEQVDGPTLATLMDSGELRDPGKAVAVVGKLLNTLQEIHPDVARINELVASVDGVLPPEVQEEIGALRENGMAHNHLDSSNIFVVEGRGVVISDFVRAARFGDEIPNRQPKFWPSEKSIQVSDPQADLYAVGALLLRMLVTAGGAVDTSGDAAPIVHQLIDVAQTAISEDSTKRFKTAAEFLDALTAVVAVSELPEVKVDLFELHREIEALVVAGSFDEALAKCPSSWTHTIEKINEKRSLAHHTGALLLEMHGLTLRYDGHVEFGSGTTIGGKDHNGGIADSYIVTVPGGGVLEIRVFTTFVDGVTERWVGVEQGFGHPDRMNHAVRSHRMSIFSSDGVEWMQVTQSQLKKSGKFENQATKKMVSAAELSAPLGGLSALSVLEPFGVTALKTREEVFGDKTRSRNQLAAVFQHDSIHAPAVVHFISRLIPLYMGVTED